MTPKDTYSLCAPGIYYVGTDDHITPEFENLWPLPYGVSYNSYIVKGSEATALIDGVTLENASLLEANIRALGIDKIDYLIVNHMEPDHSGSIPELIRRWPGIRIVGNRITADMLAGFSAVPREQIHIIADGDTLSLGDKSLRFITTPMVHWPETMMTFEPDTGTLFTGDAFGGFGALDGNIYADTRPSEQRIDEIYRYYACIVAKYGKFVHKAISKVEALDIRNICPTHGLIWRNGATPLIMNLYSRMSRWEGEKGCVVVAASMYGHTLKMADHLASRLGAAGMPVKVHNASFSNLSFILADIMRYKNLAIGSATYSMEVLPTIETLLQALRIREIANRPLAFFTSYAWAPDAAIKRLNTFAEQMNLPVAGQAVMKQNILPAAQLDALATAITQAATCES